MLAKNNSGTKHNNPAKFPDIQPYQFDPKSHYKKTIPIVSKKMESSKRAGEEP